MTGLNPKTFLSDESGTISVDWVVITAAVVGLGIGAVLVLGGEFQELSTDVASVATDIDPTENTFTTID